MPTHMRTLLWTKLKSMKFLVFAPPLPSQNCIPRAQLNQA